MKKLLRVGLVGGLVLLSAGCGAGYRMQQGALIGATVGALAGHDIGEDAESTLIGAAIGGVAGAVIGDGIDQYETTNGANYRYNTPAYTPYRTQQAPRRGY